MINPDPNFKKLTLTRKVQPWTDKAFPPDDYSIYGTHIHDFKWDVDITWKRASEVYETPHLFPEDREITPENVI